MERRVAHSTSRLVAALLTLTLAGCGREPGAKQFANSGEEGVFVDTIAPDSGAAGVLILPARIKALEEVTVAARLSGRVSALLVREGESVRGGQTLARFDAPESRRAQEAARHESAAAQASLETTARQLARLDSLLARGIASSRDREVVETEHQNARSRAAAAAASVESVNAMLAPRAPFSGVVARRYVDAGADVTPGTPLFDLRSNDGVEAVVAIPETALPAVAGARWEIEGPGGTWQPAGLERLDGTTDPATRTRAARVAPRAAVALESGAFTHVRLHSDRLPERAGLRLPASAIVSRGALRGAYVIRGDRAELRWLQVGREEGGAVEVLAGLGRDERVARDVTGLSDGARVRVRP